MKLTRLRQRLWKLDYLADLPILLACQREIEWANVYNQSIAGRPWLQNLNLSPGRWAANYSLLYLIFRAVTDYKIKSILEFGLGESSRLIASIIANELKECKHVIFENDEEWLNYFNSRTPIKSEIVISPTIKKKYNGEEYNSYICIEKYKEFTYDLYIVDGPLGSDRFSRFDICTLASEFNSDSEFMILIDDLQRSGDMDTFEELQIILQKQNIPFEKEIYEGSKPIGVIATKKYKFILSV